MKKILIILAATIGIIVAVVVSNIITDPVEKLVVSWKEYLFSEEDQKDDDEEGRDVVHRAIPLPREVSRVAFRVAGMLGVESGESFRMCTAFVIDPKRRLAATALHCLETVGARAHEYGVLTFTHLSAETIFKGGRIPAKLHSVNADADIALLQLLYVYNELEDFEPTLLHAVIKESVFALAAQELAWGQIGADGNKPKINGHAFYLDTFRGTVSNIGLLTQKSSAPNTVDILLVIGEGRGARTIQGGFSGGPVFDEYGNIVGIVNAKNEHFSIITSSDPVQRLLNQAKK